MAALTMMTTRGRVTVPRDVREKLGLEPGDKMVFTMLGDGTVVMRPETRRLAEPARPGQSNAAADF